MAIDFPTPNRFIFNSPSVQFSAQFGTPTPGIYDFGVPANTIQLFPTTPGTIYRIENFAIGGNISEENYLNSVLIMPTITLKTMLGNAVIFKQAMPIVKYYDDREATTFVNSDKQGDSIVATFSGQLKQIAETLGLAEILIFFTASIYEITSKEYNMQARGTTKTNLNKTGN